MIDVTVFILPLMIVGAITLFFSYILNINEQKNHEKYIKHRKYIGEVNNFMIGQPNFWGESNKWIEFKKNNKIIKYSKSWNGCAKTGIKGYLFNEKIYLEEVKE